MTWKIKTLRLGYVELNRRRMISNATGNPQIRVPVQSWLLIKDDQYVVIDTGFRHGDTLMALGDGVQGVANPEENIVRQLAIHGVSPEAVSYVLHTHLHIDHAGQTDQFPLETVAVVNRRELEYAASGLSGPSYPAADIKHLIDRLHAPGALRLLDLELTTQETVMSGIYCMPAFGHTEGSMLIYVESDEGLACFCGDLIYSVFYQLCANTSSYMDPVISANTVLERRREKASIKRLLNSAQKFKLFPSHDHPVWIENGQVRDRLNTSKEFLSGCWCELIQDPFSRYRSEQQS